MLMKIYCREGFNLYLAFDQARAFLLVLGLKLILSLASTIVSLAIWQTFLQLLFEGYAKDGGLYLPERIPEVSPEERSIWSKLTYPELSVEILSKFVSSDEIPKEDLKLIVEKATKRFLCVEEPTEGQVLQLLIRWHLLEWRNSPNC